MAKFGKRLFVAGLAALAAWTGGATLHAQCDYYVSTTGIDYTKYPYNLSYNSSYGTSVSTAFLTLQGVHDYILQNASSTYLGVKPINICVESGTYTAWDYNANTYSGPNVSAIENATTSADVLDISLAGGPGAEVTFMPDAGAFVLLIQSGWQAINIAPTASSVPKYVTVTGFNIQGQSYLIDQSSALQAFAKNLTSSRVQGIPFFDGNCIAMNGNFSGTQSPGKYAGIPSHITISNTTIAGCGGGGIAAVEADYVTLTGNSVMNCSFWSIFGTSGISLLNSIDSDGNTGITKNVISGNWVDGNQENVAWTGYTPPTITDGEGIIIDSNLNSVYLPINNSPITVPSYASRTVVANNVVWNNGSSGIEVFQSQHVDVEGNSTYGNVTEQYLPDFPGRSELWINHANDVNVSNNVFESVAPSLSGVSTTSVPLLAENLYIPPAPEHEDVYFENNVYFAVGVQHGPTFAGSTGGATGFDEAAANEVWEVYPGIGSTTNGVPVTTSWPDRIDLSLQTGIYTVSENGCQDGGTFCGLYLTPTGPYGALQALDVNGVPRTIPYPSGAFATTHQ